MQGKILLLTFLVFLQYEAISAQRQWVPPTTTAAEMRNPYTWYWPYAIAASEAYRDYFVNAQQISNQLYQQAYIAQTLPLCPPTATAAEMRNPYIWYWPYAIAASGAYKSFFKNSQQAYVTQAFPWAPNQAGQVAGQAGQAGQAAGQAGQSLNPNWNGPNQQGWNGRARLIWN